MVHTIWFTGLPGSGKSTLARALERWLQKKKRPCMVLDGDELRSGLCRDLGFSEADRRENIRRTAEVARLLNASNIHVLVALVSPLAVDRTAARQTIGDAAFVEVHVSTPLSVCEKRDPKGLYRRARAGEIELFTGISANYDTPANPQLALDTSQVSVQKCLQLLAPFFDA